MTLPTLLHPNNQSICTGEPCLIPLVLSFELTLLLLLCCLSLILVSGFSALPFLYAYISFACSTSSWDTNIVTGDNITEVTVSVSLPLIFYPDINFPSLPKATISSSLSFCAILPPSGCLSVCVHYKSMRKLSRTVCCVLVMEGASLIDSC